MGDQPSFVGDRVLTPYSAEDALARARARVAEQERFVTWLRERLYLEEQELGRRYTAESRLTAAAASS